MYSGVGCCEILWIGLHTHSEIPRSEGHTICPVVNSNVFRAETNRDHQWPLPPGVSGIKKLLWNPMWPFRTPMTKGNSQKCLYWTYLSYGGVDSSVDKVTIYGVDNGGNMFRFPARETFSFLKPSDSYGPILWVPEGFSPSDNKIGALVWPPTTSNAEDTKE